MKNVLLNEPSCSNVAVTTPNNQTVNVVDAQNINAETTKVNKECVKF